MLMGHAFHGLRHLWSMVVDSPHMQAALDGTAVASGIGTITLAKLDVIHGAEEVVIGALVIMLLVLRIWHAATQRRDRERQK